MRNTNVSTTYPGVYSMRSELEIETVPVLSDTHILNTNITFKLMGLTVEHNKLLIIPLKKYTNVFFLI